MDATKNSARIIFNMKTTIVQLGILRTSKSLYAHCVIVPSLLQKESLLIPQSHIDRDCKSDPAVAKRNKVYTNKCSVKKCKQKEMMKVQCDQCKQSYCLKHRHAQVRCKEIPMKACKYEPNYNCTSMPKIPS